MTVQGWTERAARRMALALLGTTPAIVARPDRRSCGNGFVLGHVVDRKVLTHQQHELSDPNEAAIDAAADKLLGWITLHKPTICAQLPRITDQFKYECAFAEEDGIVLRGISERGARVIRLDILYGGCEALTNG